ncbi:hypothetical protein ACUUL3_00360 [Thiovibrio sp. JS02]
MPKPGRVKEDSMNPVMNDVRKGCGRGEAVRFGLGADFADLFAARGWNLYAAGGTISSYEELRELIGQGRAWPARENQRYLLLPRTRNPGNAEEVCAAISAGPARYPLFLDECVEQVAGRPALLRRGAYIIESVLLTRQEVFIFIDADAMLLLDVPIPREIVGMENPCLAFDVFDMYDRIGQVSRAYACSRLAA